MSGELTGKTFSFKVDVDIGDAEAKLAQLETRFKSVQAAAGKNTSSQLNLNLDDKAFSQRLQAASQKSSAAAATVQPQVTQAVASAPSARRNSPSGGGGGNSGGGGGGNNTTGGYLGSGARGDRQGGFVGRVKSVAEFAVASTAIRGGMGALSKGASVIVDVQNQIQQLNKVIDTSAANLEDLKKTAISTAKEYGSSTVDVLKSFQIFAQQGLPVEDVKKFGKAVIAAKNVSEFDVEELSGLFSSASKAFSKDIGANPQKLTDSLLAVEGKYAVSEKDLGEVMKRIGPQASQQGISMHELNALTTITKERTRAPAEEIATALKFILKNTGSDETAQKKVQDIAKSAGARIDFTTPEGDLRNTYDVLKDISDLYPQLTSKKKADLGVAIGGTRFLSKFAALMQGFGESEKIVGIGQNASGETLRRNQIIMQSVSKQTDKTGVAFESLALSIGSGLTDPMITALRSAEALFNVLDKIASTKIPGLSQVSNAISGIGGTSPENQKGTSIGSIASAVAVPLAFIVGRRLLGGGARLLGAVGGAAGAAGVTGAAAGVTGAVGGAAAGAAGRGLLSKLGGGAFNLITGATLSSIFGRVLGRSAGLVGAAAGPLGAIGGVLLTSMITDAVISGVGRMFETGRERADRVGLVGQRVKATEGINSADNLKRITESLDGLNNELDLATNPKRSQEKKDLSNSGVVTRSPQSIVEEQKKTQDSLDQFLQSNEKLLRESKGVEITKTGKVNFNGKDVKTDTQARKQLIDKIRIDQTANEASAEMATNLSSFSEIIDSASSDTENGLGRFRKALTVATGRGFDTSITEGSTFTKEFSLKDKALIDKESKTGEVTKEFVQPFIENLNTALVNGVDPKKISEDLLKTGSKNLGNIANLATPEQGDKVNSLIRDMFSNGNGKGAVELTQGVLLKRAMDDAARASITFRGNVVAGFNAGEKSTESIANILEQSKTGDIVQFNQGGDKGLGFGKIVEDVLGNKKIQTFTNETDRGYNKNSQINTAKSTIQSIQEFLGGLGGGVKVFRPGKTLVPNPGEYLDKDIQRVGFGAGKVVTAPSFNTGPNRLSELSDMIAGTFQGSGSSGPEFNKQLQQFLQQSEELQKINTKDFGDITTGTKSSESDKFNQAKTQEESASLIVRAIESFGRVVKTLDSSIQKFQMFQNKQTAREMASVTSTGPLAKFGGEAIPVTIGKTKQELSPIERATVELPNSFKQLSKLQAQISEMGNVQETILNERDNVNQALDNASTGSLKNIDQQKLSDMLSGLAQKSFISDSSLSDGQDIINTLTNQDNASLNSSVRGDLTSQLREILTGGLTTASNATRAATDNAKAVATPLEIADSTAASLESLRKNAEEASRSLSLLDKLGKSFNNMDRALGQGPFGNLGQTGQPTIYEQKKGSDFLNPADFSKMNSFEQRREMIRKLSSDDVRSGQTKVLDQNFNPISSINDQQKKAQLRALDIEEERAKKGQIQSQQREQLSRKQQQAKEAITGIDNILNTSTLTPQARQGLKGLQQSLFDIGDKTKTPEKSFVTPRGDVNLRPFKVLDSLSTNIASLLPKDQQSPEVQNYLKQLQNNVGGISGKDGTAGAPAPVTELQGNTTATTENTTALNANTASRGGTSSQPVSTTAGAINTAGQSSLVDSNVTSPDRIQKVSDQYKTSVSPISTLIASATQPLANPLGAISDLSSLNTNQLKGGSFGGNRIIAPSGSTGIPGIDEINKQGSSPLFTNVGERKPESLESSGITKLTNPDGSSLYTNVAGDKKEPIPGTSKIESENKLLYKTDTAQAVDKAVAPKTEKAAEEGSSKIGDGISKSLAEGSDILSRGISSALESGSKAFQAALESGASILQSAIGELSKSMASRPAPVPAPTPKGVGGKESNVEGMLEQFVTEQARREEDRKVKMDEMQTEVATLNTVITDFKIKLDQAPDLEVMQTFVNQSVQETKNIAEKAASSAEIMSKQILDLNNQVNTIDAKANSTQMLAEQARARGN